MPPWAVAKDYLTVSTINAWIIEAQTRLATPNGAREALVLAEQATRTDPRNAEAWLVSAEARLRLGLAADAISCAQRAIGLNPGLARAFVVAGKALRALGRPQDAEAHLGRAISLDASLAEAHLEAGHLASDAGLYDAAAQHYERAVRADPDSAEAHYYLANMLKMQSRVDEAIAHYTAAIDRKPGFAEAFANRARILPIIYDEQGDIARHRARYEAGLSELERAADLSTPTGIAFAANGIVTSTNFYLQYQGLDDRDLQARYGQYVCKVMSAMYPKWAKAIPRRARARGARLRIGYVSPFLRNHNGAAWLRGWLCHHDRKRLEIFCYHTGAKTDAFTQEFQRLSDHFTHLPGDFEKTCARIHADRLDVLVHPELGMDGYAMAMAGLRLAPAQCVGWGHPITSGLPTMDYWLSSDLMEPENGAAHFTEQLVRLPNMAHVYSRAQRDMILATKPPKTRTDLGLPEGVTLFLATQSLFKYLPEHDWLFPAIARAVPGARIVFVGISSVEVVKRFMARLDRAFVAEGMNVAEHCIMLPRQSPDDYVTLNRLTDVFLDNPSWSGNNTCLTALDCELPIVTCPTVFMRGRHSYGNLTMLGVTETIARDLDEYVAIAARLGNDREFRDAMRQRIRERVDGLYEDVSVVAALDTFYQSVVRDRSA
jgi:predicted O-linked N-acetylglucosamine transferase (SPINDLY family)